MEFEINDADLQRQVVDLIKKFRMLPKEIARRRLRSVMRKAFKPFEPALRGNTPYRSGTLMRSVTTKIKVYDKPTHGAVVGIGGYARGSLRKKRGQFVVSGSGAHAIILERGTKARTRKNGGSTGVGPARHMLRQTYDALGNPILQTLVTELAASLEKTAAELGGKKA